MKITTITNLEIASICNRACPYCPSSSLAIHRPATLMHDDTFDRALDVIRTLVKRGTQQEINLFGIGESTLHPRLAYYAAQIRMVHPAGNLRLNTNGHLMDKALALDLKHAGITDVHVTDHDAETTLKAMAVLEAAGIRSDMNRDFVTGPNNWAGQVRWVDRIDYQIWCSWLGAGKVMIMADGNVTRCCMDAYGAGIMGHVDDADLLDRELVPFDLCETCHHYRE